MTLPADDHDVTKLYHEGSADEPPAALDRAILKAARENNTPAREPRKPWWLRFALPLQLSHECEYKVTHNNDENHHLSSL